MPKDEPIEEEPDEELLFPNFNLSEIEKMTPSMVDKTFDTLLRTNRAQKTVIKYQRKEIKALYQEKIISDEKYKALQESIVIKQTNNALTYVLTAVTSTVITIGGGFIFVSQVFLGVLIIFVGLFLAWITARTSQVSKNKRRKG